MPSIVVKCSLEEDLYLEWSTISEAPTFVGTRAELKRYGITEERLQRADALGSSTQYGELWWNDKGTIYQQQGWLPRERFSELALRCLAREPFQEPKVADLLIPFEDEGG